MKAALKLIFLVMACALLGAQGIAISESEPTVPPLRHILDISLSVSPDELVESGDVTLTFTIRNNSEYDADNLYMASVDGHHSESLGQVAAGTTQTYTRVYSVSDDELDSGRLSFTISHDDIVSGGEPVDYSVEALISRAEAAPGLEFTRHVSTHSVTAGASVLITYRVRNSGNVPLTRIRVTDSLGSFTGQVDILEPGETKTFSSRITVNSDVTSKPTASYYAGSVTDDELNTALDELSIDVVEPALSAGLTLDRQSANVGDTVNGVITIGASGADFTDVAVIDDIYNTIIADTLELRAGETLTVTCSWPVREVSDYRVRVEGVDATGERRQAYSDTSGVALTGEFSYSELSVEANAQTPELSRAGKARIMIAITNSGNVAARDVKLSEAKLGEIRTFEFVPAGEPTVKSILVDVNEDTEYLFSIEYTGDDGETVAVECAPVSIAITDGGAEPAAELDDGDRDRKTYEINVNTVFFWMMGAGGVVLLVLIVMLIVSHDRSRRERKLRMQLGIDRRRDVKAKKQRPARKSER